MVIPTVLCFYTGHPNANDSYLDLASMRDGGFFIDVLDLMLVIVFAYTLLVYYPTGSLDTGYLFYFDLG
jgi:hypothetical protein